MSIAQVSQSLAANQTRQQLPVKQTPQAPEGAVSVRAGAPSSSEVVTLPRPGEIPARDERPSIDPQRFRRVLNKGLRRLARGVRNELREVARDLDLDRGERRELRREVRGAYRSFRTELRDAFRASRSEETIVSDQLIGTIKSSFKGLIADIKQIVRDAAESRPADPSEVEPVAEGSAPADSPTTQPTVVSSPVTTPESTTGPPAGAVTIAANRTTAGSTVVTSPGASGQPVEATEAFEEAIASPFVTRASSFIETYRAVVTRVEGPDGQVQTTTSYSYESQRYEYNRS